MKLQDIELRLGQLSAALDAVRFPSILVDRTGRIILANTIASPLFQDPPAFRIDAGGRLALKSDIETSNLRQAIEAATTRPQSVPPRNLEIVVNNHLSGSRLAISILALANSRRGRDEGHDGTRSYQPGSVVIIARQFSPPAVSADALQLAFGLTPAEARLTGLLASGSSLREAAQTIGVSYWTVMTQVKSCYQKTGTHRQAELVALALNVRSNRS